MTSPDPDATTTAEKVAEKAVPYNEVRLRPDGGALAWHRPADEDDDAQPWLVIEEDPIALGVMRDWQPPEHVADWTVLAPAATTTVARTTARTKAAPHA
jgi:hypothetical protein